MERALADLLDRLITPDVIALRRLSDKLVEVDRLKAATMGLSQKDVATSMLTSLASSSVFAPNFWLNPKNLVNYFVVVQTPQRQIHDLQTLMTKGNLALDLATQDLKK